MALLQQLSLYLKNALTIFNVFQVYERNTFSLTSESLHMLLLIPGILYQLLMLTKLTISLQIAA